MSRRCFHFLLPLFFLTAKSLAAQTTSGSSFRFERIPSELGLSQNFVGAIMQDRKGFLWIGTRDGLNRFDGYQFTVYRHDPFDSTSLSENYITTLLEDRAGRIWVGTFGGGLNLFEREREIFHRSLPDSANPNSLSHERITAMVEDQSGTIWIGTHGGGVTRLALPQAAKTLAGAIYTRFMQEPENPDNLILNLALDQNNLLWVATPRAIYQLAVDSARHTIIRFGDALPHDAWKKLWEKFWPDYTMAAGANGKIWIGGALGLISWEASANRYTFYELNATVPWSRDGVLWEETGARNVLWYGNWQGLRRIDLEARTSQHIQHNPHDAYSISEGGIKSICEDQGGVLWFGSGGEGLFKHDPKAAPFSSTSRGEKLSLWRGTSIRALGEIPSGGSTVLLARSGEAMLQLDRRTGAVSDFAADWQNFPVSEYFLCMLEDRQGVLWLGGTRGVHRLEPRRAGGGYRAVAHYQPINGGEHAANSVYKILQDRNGEIWITTNTLIARIEQTRGDLIKYQHSTKDPDVVAGQGFPFLYEDRNGIFWLGGFEGLHRFDPATGSFRQYRNSPREPRSLSYNLVRAVHEDPFAPEKFLWVATAGGGLNRFERASETFTHFTEKDGLPDNVIYSILSDEAGNLWMSTNKGIAKFNPHALTFKNYNVQEGLQDNEFNTGAYFKSASGELFFGGIRGFNAFYPKDIQGNSHAPPVAITGLQIFNKPVAFTSSGAPLKAPIAESNELTLRYDQDVFTFEFAALDYTNPAKNQYAYKMENFDREWQNAGTARKATYTNLDPGAYVFRVKAANNDGVWNEVPQGGTLRITITPPWWQTWWAYAFYVFAAAAILYSLRRYERNRQQLKHQVEIERLQAEKHHVETTKLQELDRMKSRFFANLSHEFRTPLTLILGPVAQLLNEAAEEKTRSRLRLVHANAKRLLGLINQLLDLSKLESGKMPLRAAPGDLATFLRGLASSFTALAERKGQTLRFESKEEKLLVYFDRDKMEKIFSNLLSNAIKFTPEGGSVEVSIEQSAGGGGQNAAGLEQRAEGEEQRAKRILSSSASALRPLPSALVFVKDTGIGIPADKLPHVFDRFYQVDNSPTREHEGTGIGLALAKELVELHHGKIEVASVLGEGTTFTVRLPLGKEHLQPEEVSEQLSVVSEQLSVSSESASGKLQVASEENFESPTLQQSTTPSIHQSNDPSIPKSLHPEIQEHDLILIVEDNADMRRFVREELAPRYRVLEAADGEEGWQKALETIPDLVISDVMMPKMNGYELCSRLKTDERTSHVPVILLTAKAGTEDKIEGLHTGADDYLSKPFDRHELAARVQNLIALRRKLVERFAKRLVLKPSEIVAENQDDAFLKKVMTVVEEHLGDENFEVDTLCRGVGMSRAQLHRKLKALVDQSAMELMRGMRLQRAADLLRQNAGTIAEIAYQVGFSSQAHFTRSFHERFGCSPSEFKKGNG